jgi:hypothetical protein
LSLDLPLELVLLLALSFTIFATFFWKRRKLSPSAQLDVLLRPFKLDEVKEVIIPDGIGGLLEVEQIVLVEQGLLLIETYSISGNIFGADHIDEWSQIVDGRSYKFTNPLRRLRTVSQALKLLAPNVPIFCKVVFNADSHFPKGKPDEVSTLATMTDDMEVVLASPAIKKKAEQDWLRCLRIARKNGQSLHRDGAL